MSKLPKTKNFVADGLQFSCTGCHACCRHHQGYVFFSAAEMAKMCSYLRISPSVFRQKYTRQVSWDGGNLLSLTETAEHDCIFWDHGCSIYPARPLQCSSYPFWPHNISSPQEWDAEAQQCPGINQGQHHSAAKIANILEQLAQRKLLNS